MRAKHALEELRSYARRQGMALDHLTARDVADLMIGYYISVRADDCDVNEDGDMLLFRWGLRDDGDGEIFEYNLTRQLVFSERVRFNSTWQEEPATWQLSLVMGYRPIPSLSDLGSGSHWCICPEEAEDLRSFIASHPSTRYAEHHPLAPCLISYDPVMVV